MNNEDKPEAQQRRARSERSEVGTPQGSLMVELVVACAVLSVVFAVVVPVVSRTSELREETENRLVALQEASNVLERLCLLEWEALTQSGTGSLKLSPAAKARLREARLNVRVVNEPFVVGQRADEHVPPFEFKRVVVEVAWKNEAGRSVPPVRLSMCFYKRPQQNEQQ